MDKETIAAIKQVVKEANYVVFLGGAGVSTASGIPDFRSPQGLYKVKSKYGVPYEEMLSHEYFYAHPDKFYDFYWESMVNKEAKPNKAHEALAKFERNGHHVVVITQNIDGLHQDAGSKTVLEAHGSTKRYFCPSCGRKYALSDIEPKGVPHCSCGSIIKPDVVLYGEPLDQEVLEMAIASTIHSSLLIIGGTSLNVYPIASLPSYFIGGKKIIINKEPTSFDKECDYVIHEDIGEVLTKILE